MIALAEPLVFTQRDIILDFTGKHRLPAMYSWKEFVQAGGLIAYGADIDANYRRAAFYVDRILKGTKPADLPVKFELFLNMKTAKALGLAVPQALLLRADQILE